MKYTAVRIQLNVLKDALEQPLTEHAIASTSFYISKKEIIVYMSFTNGTPPKHFVAVTRFFFRLVQSSVLTAAFPVVSFASNASEVRLADVQRLVSTAGASAAVHQLYSQPTHWEALLQNVEAAGPQWVQLAVALKKGADAGAAHSLDEALGGALMHQPKLLLTLASRNELAIQDFCRAPDVDDPRYSSYDININALRKRIAAVKEVKTPDLAPVQTLCLKSFAVEESEIARYFEVGRPKSN